MIPAATSFYYSNGESITQEKLSIPSYDSQVDIATDLVAPFLLITILLQTFMQRALSFTLDSDNSKLKKNSLLMALAITAMLVPTQFFRMVNQAVAVIFGSIAYLFFILVGGAFLYALYQGVTS
ncbi:MAG: hypothetical protein ABEJ98_00010 [Candidatus Nanohaloarchaea archaeon]